MFSPMPKIVILIDINKISHLFYWKIHTQPFQNNNTNTTINNMITERT